MRRKFAYDVWGDTVNVANRMESSGVAGEVNVSGATHDVAQRFFLCEPRGRLPVKNRGALDMYLVRRIRPELSADEDGRRPNDTSAASF